MTKDDETVGVGGGGSEEKVLRGYLVVVGGEDWRDVSKCKVRYRRASVEVCNRGVQYEESLEEQVMSVVLKLSADYMEEYWCEVYLDFDDVLSLAYGQEVNINNKDKLRGQLGSQGYKNNLCCSLKLNSNDSEYCFVWSEDDVDTQFGFVWPSSKFVLCCEN